MLSFTQDPYVVVAISFILGLLMTIAVRRFAWKYDFVAKPKSDRWHNRPTAMLGGAAIFLATVGAFFLFVPMTRLSLIIFGASALLFLVGLVDDILNIRPYQKLIGQLIGAGVVIAFGLKLPITGYEIVDIWITVFWLIGITNAINLLDNMDGLAAGIATIGEIGRASCRERV